jgi:glutamine synthetase
MNNVEIKTIDHTANIGLAMTAIIVCGLEGIKQKMVLPTPYSFDPDLLDKKERKSRGIQKLPLTLDKRIKAIYSDEGLPLR